jgi:hypothetical protein
MVRACRSMPQYTSGRFVEKRMRSPPLFRWFVFAQRQQTTAVCGGGGLNKYQARPGGGSCGALRTP